MQRTYVIAEIGINANGDLNIAKKLIDLATVAGCDSVKFQKRNPEICVPEDQKNQPKSTPWGDMTYLEYKHRMEFNEDQYKEIDLYCKDKNIEWSASPWDMGSLEFLMQFDIPWIKIPSAMLTNNELLRAAAVWVIHTNNGFSENENPKKVIISTGMSSEEEVDNAVKFLQQYLYSKHDINHDKNLVIMHCNSSYPAAIDELNLSCIKTLYEKYHNANIEIGYSGHEFTLGTTVASILLGATFIERHITLDRTMWGSDHMASVGPKGIIGLVSGIRELERAYGNGKIRIYDSELEPRKKLRGY